MITVASKKGANYAFAVTPSDTLTLANDPNNTKKFSVAAIMCVASGNLTAVTAAGQTITFPSVPAYTVIGGNTPILFKQVLATGTTGQYVAIVPNN